MPDDTSPIKNDSPSKVSPTVISPEAAGTDSAPAAAPVADVSTPALPTTPEETAASKAPTVPTQPPEPQIQGHRSSVMTGVALLLLLVVVAGFLTFHTTPKAKAPVISRTTSAPAAPSIQPAQVEITSSGFVPATVSIKVGQAVVWTDADSAAHSVKPDAPKPLSVNEPSVDSAQLLNLNDSYSYIFDQAGTYSYHDGASSAHGTVIVK